MSDPVDVVDELDPAGIPGDQAAAPGQRNLIALLGDLAGAGVDIAQNTLHLAACEGRVILRRLVARLGLFFAFLIVATTGLLLILVGVALFLEHVTTLPAWLAFLIVGVTALAGGGFMAWRMIRLLGNRDLAFPATFSELQKDLDLIRGREHDEQPR